MSDAGDVEPDIQNKYTDFYETVFEFFEFFFKFVVKINIETQCGNSSAVRTQLS